MLLNIKYKPIILVQPRHLLLKCRYQAWKVRGHVIVCQGCNPANFLRNSCTNPGKWEVMYFVCVLGVWLRHFLLKCLYQAKKVIGHVFVCCGVYLPLSTILLLDFIAVPTMWDFSIFILSHFYINASYYFIYSCFTIVQPRHLLLQCL